MIPDWDFGEQAACRQAVRDGKADLNDWFPKLGHGWRKLPERVQRAATICAGCPVRIECHETYVAAVPATQRSGIWGGVLYGTGRNTTAGGLGRWVGQVVA